MAKTTIYAVKCPNCGNLLTIKGKKIKCSNCDYVKEDS